MALSQTHPYNKGHAITKSDTVNFDGVTYSATGQKSIPCDAIYVGGAGVVVVVWENGSINAFTCVAGQTLPVKAIRVNSTDTTATLMIALYYGDAR